MVLLSINYNSDIGKTRLAMNTISQFLQENPNNRAVYVGLHRNSSIKAFESVNNELKNRVCCFTIGNEGSDSSDAEYFLVPK